MPFTRSTESRWSLALIVAAVLAVAAYLGYGALSDPEVPFLPRAADAEWITFPRVASLRVRTVAELPAIFEREIELAAEPREALLRVRLFREGTVQLNGREVPLTAATEGNWKRERTANVAGLLVRGKNAIRATARAGSGGPALWLALTVDGVTFASDESWNASAAGSTVRRARSATVPMDDWGESSEGSLGGALRDPRLNPRPLDALSGAWPALLLFGAVSAGAVFVLRRVARHRELPFDLRAVLALAAVSAVLYGGMFLRNAKLDLRAGFDATGHVAYVNRMLEDGQAPQADEGWEMYQPPLYYALVAGALKLGGYQTLDTKSMHVARFVGWLALTLQTLFVALGLRVLLAERPRAAFAGACVAAMLPMHLYLYQYVTNEGLAAMLVSASLWIALRILRDDSTRLIDHALLGLALGLAMLTKYSAMLAIVVVLGVRIGGLALGPRRAPLVWLRTVGVTAAMIVLVCGWHYGRVHERFGRFLVGNYEADSGFDWWQDPGYRTSADYARFGVSLTRPLLSATHSCADALYSTLWGDGLIGGASRLDVRPPWNYDLMAAGMLLALLPSLAAALGLAGALARLVREPRASWFLALGLLAGVLSALIALTLKLPFYAQAKAVYAASVAIPLCSATALGVDWLARRARSLAPVVWTLLGAWAIASFATFWSAGGADLQRIPPSVPDAGGASRENPDAQVRLAVARLQGQDVDGAIAACRDAIAANPWSASGHYTCGQAYQANGEQGKALEHFDLAARASPLTEGYTLGLAAFLIDQGRWREAAAAIERTCARFDATHRPIPDKLSAKRKECREHP